MRKAQYRIDLHSMVGRFKSIGVRGTRVQVRARCRQLQTEHDCGTRINFIRYLEDLIYLSPKFTITVPLD